MEITDNEAKEAQAFGEFYIDKMENHQNRMHYYFSEEITLDWFGHTVKGEKNVIAFLKKTLSSVNHIYSDFKPAKKIGFRDTHLVKVPRIPKFIPLGLMSPPRMLLQKSQAKTPKKQMLPSTSTNLRGKNKRLEQGQGDGCHNNNNSSPPEMSMSPMKKIKLNEDLMESLETIEDECDNTQQVKYVVSDGAVEFHKPSTKKLQLETKWQRPCKLSIAYTKLSCSDYTIYLIIYEGNVKCRRNLMKDFEAEMPEH